jgi:hypothetical protein
MQFKLEADTLGRVCDLVDEARWRYDLQRVSFMESVFTSSKSGSYILDLWIMGEDSEGWWMVTATRDQRVGGFFVPAGIDAGNRVLEGRNLGELLMLSRDRRWLDESVYERVVSLAQQESLRKGTL